MPRLICRTALARTAVRRGFTLIELMVSVVLFGLVMASLMGVLARQQRFYRGTNEVIDTRSQLRQAASVLPTDMRSLSSVGLDIKSVSDTMVEFMATFGSAVMCTKGGTSSFIVAPDTMSRHTLTSWLWRPQRGDSAFILDEGTKIGSEDDRWLRVKIDSSGTATSGCNEYLTASEQSSATRYRFVLNALTPLTTTVVAPGAVVRFARPVRYRFYRSAGDNNWYLGYQSYTVSGPLGTGTWSGVQPLAGPYRPYVSAGSAANGLQFLYFNQAGTQVTATDSAARVSIARIDVSLKGQGTQTRNTAISSGGVFRDSLLVRIAIRNRR